MNWLLDNSDRSILISNRYLKRPILVDHHPVKTLKQLQVNKASLFKTAEMDKTRIKKNFSWMYF